ncbi:ankyrin repeat domain-containing protein, partial [Candidatus Methanodesulfokora washburnensis]
MTLNEDLIEAARWGDLEKVKKLLDRGADVNARDKD